VQQPILHTDRLILREILPEDEDGLYELDTDPLVHRYLGNRPVTSRAQICEVIAFIRHQYHENGIGRWAVLEQDSRQFIGWAGLKKVKEPLLTYSTYYDIGYRLIRSYWGKGYATEAALASLAYGFQELHLNEVFALANTGNHASHRVLSKCGLSTVDHVTYDGSPHDVYRIDRKAWECHDLS